jgi:hypothetical protein
LRRVFDERRVELGLRMMDVDLHAELQDGYFAKLMCGLRNFGPVSLPKVLAALGLEICLMPGDSKIEKSNRKVTEGRWAKAKVEKKKRGVK